MRLFPPSLAGLPRLSGVPAYLLRTLVFITLLRPAMRLPSWAPRWTHDHQLKARRLGQAVLASIGAILVAWLMLWSVVLYLGLVNDRYPPEIWRADLFLVIPWIRFLIGLLAGILMAACIEAVAYTENWWRIPMALSGLFWGLLSWKVSLVVSALAYIGHGVLRMVLNLLSLLTF